MNRYMMALGGLLFAVSVLAFQANSIMIDREQNAVIADMLRIMAAERDAANERHAELLLQVIRNEADLRFAMAQLGKAQNHITDLQVRIGRLEKAAPPADKTHRTIVIPRLLPAIGDDEYVPIPPPGVPGRP